MMNTMNCRIVMRIVATMLLFALMPAADAYAQDMPMAMDVQFPLLMKVLIFDKNLKIHPGEAITIGIVFQRDSRLSVSAKKEMMEAIDESPVTNVKGMPIRYEAIELSELASMLRSEGHRKVTLLYVTPVGSLPAVVAEISRKRKILTCTGVPRYVEQSLAYGVTLKDDAPRILINQEAMRDADADFSAQLLMISKIVR
jgi:hypothetical protein